MEGFCVVPVALYYTLCVHVYMLNKRADKDTTSHKPWEHRAKPSGIGTLFQDFSTLALWVL